MRLVWQASLVLLASASVLSCFSGDSELGQSVINPYQVQIQSIDSVTIRTSTVLEPDTFVTSTDSSMLVGRWFDATTGTAVARGFVSVDYATNTLKDQTGLRLDSLVLELGYTFTYGDTLTAVDLAVHQLRAALPYTTYYNSSSAAFDPTPLMQKTMLPRANSGSRQVRFRIPDNMAQSFWQGLLGGSITDDESIRAFWRGFALVSTSPTQTFMGFSAGSASGLRLYYHATDIDQARTSLRFPITSAHFTQLVAQRSGSLLHPLTQRTDAAPSDQTGHATYVSAGLGLRTKIEFPYLGDFQRPDDFIGLNAALLVIDPVRKNVVDNTPPPTELALYQTNNQHELVSALAAGADGSTQAVASYAYDRTAIEPTDSYTFDLTQYIGQVIRRRRENKPLLLSVPPGQTNLRELARRVTLGDGKRSTDRIRLRLYLTSGL